MAYSPCGDGDGLENDVFLRADGRREEFGEEEAYQG